MSVTLVHPHWAWLLLGLPLLWWRVRPGVRRGHIVLRAAIIAAIIVALTQPSLLIATDRRHHVFVLDQKPALTEASRSRAQQELAARLVRVPAGDPVALVQVGGQPVAARADRRVLLDDAGSLSAALARAVEAVPPGAAATVTVITDGLSNDRHWGRSISTLIERGIAVEAVALDQPRRAPFISDLVTAPAHAGERVEAIATIEGTGDDVAVALYSGDRLLATSPGVAVDGMTRVALRFTAAAAPFMPLRAVLRGGGRSDGAGFDMVAAIQPPLRLLYLGERQAGAAATLQRLLGPGVRVDARRPAEAAAIRDFAGWPVVMLDDLPASGLPAAAQTRLMQAVERRGTGLFYAGGKAAFGDGGYQLAPLAAALPVTFRQEERAERPSIALAVVIDSSGSMTGQPLELAKYVARLAVRQLTPKDQFGVVEFYGAKQWAVPMQPVRDAQAVERAIGRMQAQGSSVLFPALQEAYYGVKNAPARYKHVLVISDGDVSNGEFEQLIRHMAADRINVSTVVPVGDERGIQNMTQWARWGLGRFYYVPTDASLVQLDLSVPATTAMPSYRPAPGPVRAVAGHDWWRDLGSSPPPPLAGVVRVDVRPDAETVATAGAGTPLVASWLYGRGRVTSMMTEPLGQGTGGWAGWPRYGEWLSRVVARTAAADMPVAVTIDRTFGTIRVTLQRAGTGASGGAMPDVRLDGGRRVPLEQEAPGLFVGTVPFPQDRAAMVTVTDGAMVVRAADRAYSDTAGAHPMSALHALPLAALAKATGGASGDGARGDRIATPLWGWFALVALLLYLAEIAWRRWPLRQNPAWRDART